MTNTVSFKVIFHFGIDDALKSYLTNTYGGVNSSNGVTAMHFDDKTPSEMNEIIKDISSRFPFEVVSFP
jgi:hypothetical protein